MISDCNCIFCRIGKGISWDTPIKAIPLKDFKKIQLLGQKFGDGQVSDNAPRNLLEPSTDGEIAFMTKGTGEDV